MVFAKIAISPEKTMKMGVNWVRIILRRAYRGTLKNPGEGGSAG